MVPVFANAPIQPTCVQVQVLRISFAAPCRYCRRPATTNIRPVDAISSPMVADLYVCTPDADRLVAWARAKGIELSVWASTGLIPPWGWRKPRHRTASFSKAPDSKRFSLCVPSSVDLVRRLPLAWQCSPLSETRANTPARVSNHSYLARQDSALTLSDLNFPEVEPSLKEHGQSSFAVVRFQRK